MPRVTRQSSRNTSNQNSVAPDSGTTGTGIKRKQPSFSLLDEKLLERARKAWSFITNQAAHEAVRKLLDTDIADIRWAARLTIEDDPDRYAVVRNPIRAQHPDLWVLDHHLFVQEVRSIR